MLVTSTTTVSTGLIAISQDAKCELLAVSRLSNAKKLEPLNIHRQLYEISGENCMSVQQVWFWYREFTNSTHDEQRSGWLLLTDAVEAILPEDWRITIWDLALFLQRFSQIPITEVWPKNWDIRYVPVPQLITSYRALTVPGRSLKNIPVRWEIVWLHSYWRWNVVLLFHPENERKI